MTTRAQRAYAIRLLAGAQSRLQGAASPSLALTPVEVAALMEVSEEEDAYTEESNAGQLVRHLG